MSKTTKNTLSITEHAAAAAGRVSNLIQAVSIEEPVFKGGEGASSATNSLNETYMKNLEQGKHLDPKYLDTYFKTFAV